MSKSPSAHTGRLAAGLAVAILAMTAPAVAQFGYEPEMLIPPRAVAWRLSERGFTEIGRPRFDGRAYVVEASNPRGDRVRLFVDARDGAVLGRERLEAPLAPPARLARPAAPGYGWTEDDARPRGPMRLSERLAPPADIPPALARQPRQEAFGRDDVFPRQDAYPRQDRVSRPEPSDANPLGLNPDAKARPEPQRKVVRLAPPTRPATPRAAPEAPKPSEAAQPPAKPEAPTAALEAPKPAPPTPASVQPPPPEKPAMDAGAKASGDKASNDKASSDKAWTDPPADSKRPVRVIGGATVVPGASAKPSGDGAAAN